MLLELVRERRVEEDTVAEAVDRLRHVDDPVATQRPTVPRELPGSVLNRIVVDTLEMKEATPPK